MTFFIEARRLKPGQKIRVDFSDGTGKIAIVSAVEIHGKGMCIIKVDGERWGYMISPHDEVSVIEEA